MCYVCRYSGLVVFTDIEVSHRINLCNATQGFAECLNGRCYKVFQKCDGKLDCEDGTDESNCKLKLEFCNGNGQGWNCSERGMTDLFSVYLKLALWYPVIEWGGLSSTQAWLCRDSYLCYDRNEVLALLPIIQQTICSNIM